MFARCVYIYHIQAFKLVDKPIMKVWNTSDTSDIDYTVELGISYPNEIHDNIKEFVPAPEI